LSQAIVRSTIQRLGSGTNPLAWLRIALVFAPIMISGYVLGLPYGPNGVAFAYSAVMMLWVIPHVLWCIHGTGISSRDILLAVCRPFSSAILAGAVAYGARFIYGPFVSPVPRLILETGVLFMMFFGALLSAGEQKSLYLNLLRGLKGPSLHPKPT
jgi:PST family polysaccharide transporter